MGTTTRLLLAGGLVMTTMVTLVRPASAQAASLQIHIQDRVGLSAAALHDVEANVTSIFRHAGVTTVWTGGPQFSIIIVSADIAAQMHQSPEGERMGFAPRGGSHVAYVIETRIKWAAVTYRADKTAVMAAAIAHELGHLLLPPHAHGPVGIMRADWNATDFSRASAGQLLFRPDEAKEMRQSLVLRP
jgi:hypothetical protein